MLNDYVLQQMGDPSCGNSCIIGTLLAMLWEEKARFKLDATAIQYSKRQSKIRIEEIYL